MSQLINLLLFGAALGGVLAFIIILRLNLRFPDTIKRQFPIMLGLVLTVSFFAVALYARLTGFVAGPTIVLTAWGSALWFYWVGAVFPLTAWLHGDIRYKREEELLKKEERRNGLKERVQQGTTI